MSFYGLAPGNSCKLRAYFLQFASSVEQVDIKIDVVSLHGNANRVGIHRDYFGNAQPTGGHEYVLFISFPIATTSMVYSADFIDAKERVNDTMRESIHDVTTYPLIKIISVYDCDGRLLIGPGNPQINLLDLLSLTADTRIFELIELGCCATHSHHLLKTRCLTCVMFAEMESQDVSSFINTISRILAKYYSQPTT